MADPVVKEHSGYVWDCTCEACLRLTGRRLIVAGERVQVGNLVYTRPDGKAYRGPVECPLVVEGQP